VATQAYRDWDRSGRPFALSRPCKALRDTLRRHGYTVFDIGDEGHLQASPPEDHTPFSATGWPGTARKGLGYAIDIMPPAAGAKSKIDGKPLPSLQKLGAQIFKDRRADHGPISWLKYMNWEPQRNNGGDCWHEAWQPNYHQTTSNDRGHIHLSARTGVESSDVGDGYDPVARIHGEDDDMPLSTGDVNAIATRILGDGGMQMLFTRVEALASGRDPHTGGQANVLHKRLNAILGALSQVDEQVAVQLRADLDAIDAALAAGRTEVAGIDDQVMVGLAAATTAKEQAALLRQVLGDRAREVGVLLAEG